MEKPGGGKGEAERREEKERKKGLLHKTHQRICAVQMGIVWKKKKTGCVQVKEKQLCSKQQHYIWNLWPRYSIFTEKNKVILQSSFKRNHTGLLHGSYRSRSCRTRLCQTGLLLLFWSRAQFLCKAAKNKKKSLYKWWDNGLLYSYSGGWVTDGVKRHC